MSKMKLFKKNELTFIKQLLWCKNVGCVSQYFLDNFWHSKYTPREASKANLKSFSHPSAHPEQAPKVHTESDTLVQVCSLPPCLPLGGSRQSLMLHRPQWNQCCCCETALLAYITHIQDYRFIRKIQLFYGYVSHYLKKTPGSKTGAKRSEP